MHIDVWNANMYLAIHAQITQSILWREGESKIGSKDKTNEDMHRIHIGISFKALAFHSGYMLNYLILFYSRERTLTFYPNALSDIFLWLNCIISLQVEHIHICVCISCVSENMNAMIFVQSLILCPLKCFNRTCFGNESYLPIPRNKNNGEKSIHARHMKKPKFASSFNFN